MSADHPSEDELFQKLVEYRSLEHVRACHVGEVNQAVQTYPRSAKLWNLLGDLIHLIAISLRSGEFADLPTDFDELDCYRRAIQIDDTYAEAWESIGFVLDIKDKLKTAKRAFLKAIEHEGSAYCYAGLARVEAQLGRRTEAIEVIEAGLDLFPQNEVLESKRREIEEGSWDPD